MTTRNIVLLFALTACAVSCAPVYSVKRYGISANLTHKNTGTPITQSPVVITIDSETFRRTTDQEGSISVSADRQIKMSSLGGPAIQSNPKAQIIVSCDGYDPVKIEWIRGLPHLNSGRIEDLGVINLGNLPLIKSKSQ